MHTHTHTHTHTDDSDPSSTADQGQESSESGSLSLPSLIAVSAVCIQTIRTVIAKSYMYVMYVHVHGSFVYISFIQN